ncbi:MAG: APC family permease [Actinomycetota bacterium]|nr:APC family permease [Actinomycetota bacterium]
MGENGLNTNAKVLGVFTLAMINISLILNLRGLPMLATYGFSIVIYLLLAALVFFVPTALVSAELATAWPEIGGIHAWTKEAFGTGWAFLVAWLEWLNCVIWLPTVLGALAAILGYVITPSLSENRYFIVAVILVVFWSATFSNFRGMETSGKISSLGAFSGVIVPGVAVVLLAILWAAFGKTVETGFGLGDLMPNFADRTQLVFFIGVLLMFMGIEISSAHASEVRNPQRDYPRAIFSSALIIVIVFIMGALAVAAIVPGDKIDLLTGVVQAFDISLDAFGLGWLVPILGLLMVFGMVAQINSWLIGPAKFMLATARNGDLPLFFQKTNSRDIPVNILLVQAGIVTVYSLVYLVMPSVTDSFWLLTALASQVYLIVYIIMFLVSLKLRYSRPDTPRAYRIPGGKVGIWIVVALGICSSVFAMLMGFLPPTGQQHRGSTLAYAGFLLFGILVLCLTAWLIQRFKKPSWKM